MIYKNILPHINNNINNSVRMYTHYWYMDLCASVHISQ